VKRGVSKLRIIYIVSLVILAVLIGFTVFQPMATGGKYSEVQKEQLLETESEWIIQFSIINHEGRDQNYTINVLVGEKSYTDSVLIRDGRKFSYIHRIRRDMITDGVVSFTIYKEGEATPFEQATYYLK
jgi:uncharacterized membrane protein